MNNSRDIDVLLREDSERAIGLLYDRYGAALFGVILNIVLSRAASEDILQEVFIKIWRNRHSFDNQKGTLFTWMLRIARNAAIDFLRRGKSEPLSNIQEGEISVLVNDTVMINDETVGLRKLVGGLDAPYRLVIELVYFEGFTQEEASEKLGVPLGTLKTRVRIGLRELRKFFADPKSLLAMGAHFVKMFFNQFQS